MHRVPGWDTHDVVVDCEVIDGEPRVVGLQLTPATRGPEGAITANRLRTLPLLELARIALAVDAEQMFEGLVAVERPYRGPHPAATAADVARVWNAAYQAGKEAPRAAVCRALHIQPRTADRYIREARELGLIEPGRTNVRKTGSTTKKTSTKSTTRRTR